MILLFLLISISSFVCSFELDEGEQIQQARALVQSWHEKPQDQNQVASSDSQDEDDWPPIQHYRYYERYKNKQPVNIQSSAYIIRQLKRLRHIECIHCGKLCNIKVAHDKKINAYCRTCKQDTIIYSC